MAVWFVITAGYLLSVAATVDGAPREALHPNHHRNHGHQHQLPLHHRRDAEEDEAKRADWCVNYERSRKATTKNSKFSAAGVLLEAAATDPLALNYEAANQPFVDFKGCTGMQQMTRTILIGDIYPSGKYFIVPDNLAGNKPVARQVLDYIVKVGGKYSLVDIADVVARGGTHNFAILHNDKKWFVRSACDNECCGDEKSFSLREWISTTTPLAEFQSFWTNLGKRPSDSLTYAEIELYLTTFLPDDSQITDDTGIEIPIWYSRQHTNSAGKDFRCDFWYRANCYRHTQTKQAVPGSGCPYPLLANRSIYFDVFPLQCGRCSRLAGTCSVVTNAVKQIADKLTMRKPTATKGKKKTKV